MKHLIVFLAVGIAALALAASASAVSRGSQVTYVEPDSTVAVTATVTRVIDADTVDLQYGPYGWTKARSVPRCSDTIVSGCFTG